MNWLIKKIADDAWFSKPSILNAPFTPGEKKKLDQKQIRQWMEEKEPQQNIPVVQQNSKFPIYVTLMRSDKLGFQDIAGRSWNSTIDSTLIHYEGTEEEGEGNEIRDFYLYSKDRYVVPRDVIDILIKNHDQIKDEQEILNIRHKYTFIDINEWIKQL
jgi:hypothetical protein